MSQGCEEPSSESKLQEDQGQGWQQQNEKEEVDNDNNNDDNSNNSSRNDIDTTCWDEKPKLFEEIHSPSSSSSLLESLPDEVETYIAIIEPKLCKSLMKELGSFLPLIKVEDKMKMVAKMKEEEANRKSKFIHGDTISDGTKIDDNQHDYDDCENIIPLGHLRRVRRSTVVETQNETSHSHNNDGNREDEGTNGSAEAMVTSSPSCIEPPMKRSKRNKKNKAKNSNSANIQLEVLIGAVAHVDQLLSLSAEDNNWEKSNENDRDSRNGNGNNNSNSSSDDNKSMKHHRTRSKAMKLKKVIKTYNLQLLKKMLPGRPAKSQAELDLWNNNDANADCKNKNKNNNNETTKDNIDCQTTGPWWPTLYFNKKSDEYKIKEQEISRREEYCIMNKGILSAINDAKENYNCMVKDRLRYKGVNNDNDSTENDVNNTFTIHQALDCCNGAAIMCPNTETIISTSHEEINALIEENCSESSSDDSNINPLSKSEEKERIKQLLDENPLNTPVLFAIQGVSRKERLAAIGLGMDNDSFKNNQYLCTGYDIYLTKEPGIFESMALVHARIRRVVFYRSSDDGGLGGGGDDSSIHSLPSTNHRYRAFRVVEKEFGKLLKEGMEE